MSREAHVRFDGSGEGQFLPATLLQLVGSVHRRREQGLAGRRLAAGRRSGVHVVGAQGADRGRAVGGISEGHEQPFGADPVLECGRRAVRDNGGHDG